MKIESKSGSSINNKTGGWRTFIPKVKIEKCIGCGMCAKVCPEGVVFMNEVQGNKKKPEIDFDFCKGCGLCAEECPIKCIDMNLEEK